MILSQLHDLSKPVSAKPFFTASEGKAMSILIKKDEKLKEHISKVPAMVVCVTGKAVYKDEKGNEIDLVPGTYHPIEPLVTHSVTAIDDCSLIVIK